VADTEDFHNDGYAREQAISTKLEGYLGDCLRALEPRVSISCKVRAKSGSATVVCELGGSAGVRLGFRFLGAMLVGDIPISFIQGREDAEKTTGTVSQCYLSHRDPG